MARYPGVGEDFLENHELTAFIDKNGRRIEKEQLVAPTKQDRENLLAWQFIRHVNMVYDTLFPPHWTQRDAPHDYAFQAHDGRVLKLEIVSMGNRPEGSQSAEPPRKIQGLRAKLQAILSSEGYSRGMYIIYSARTKLPAVSIFREDLGSGNFETLSSPPNGDTLRNWMTEVGRTGRILIFKINDSVGPNIFQYDSGQALKRSSYAYLVERAVRFKEKKSYDDMAKMVLLIDDRTTWYSKKDVYDFAKSVKARRLARNTGFGGVFVIVSHGSGKLAQNSNYHILTVKEPPVVL